MTIQYSNNDKKTVIITANHYNNNDKYKSNSHNGTYHDTDDSNTKDNYDITDSSNNIKTNDTGTKINGPKYINNCNVSVLSHVLSSVLNSLIRFYFIPWRLK